MTKWYTAVNKKLDKNIITKGGEVLQMPRIPTGSLSLDVETGGGLPVGKIITISGDYSDGKTAVALKALAEFQKKWPEREIVWVDAEGAWDKEWAECLGVETEKVLIVRPEYSEQALDIAQKAIMEDVGFLVVDSMAALSPRKEAESDMESNTIALQARLNKQFMRKVQSVQLEQKFEDIPPTVVLINQLYENIGGYGAPQKEGGGRSLEYFPALKIRLKRGKLYPESKSVSDEGVEPKAQSIRFFTEKNKTAPPHRRGHFWFYFDTLDSFRQKGSYDRLEEVIRYSQKFDLIRKRGSMFDIVDPGTGEVESVRGSNGVAEYLRGNSQIWQALEASVMEKVNGERKRTVSKDEGRQGSPIEGETEAEDSGTGSSEADQRTKKSS